MENYPIYSKLLFFLFQLWLDNCIALIFTNTVRVNAKLIFLTQTSVTFKKITTSGRLVSSKNGILRATVGSSSAVVLADFDLLFRRLTNFVSVGPSNNIFFDDGRFLRLKQSLNNPSTNRRSLSNHQKTGFFSVCRWLVDIKAFRITLLSAGRHRLTTENWPRIAGLSGDFDKSTDGSLINWSLTNVVTSECYLNKTITINQ